MITEMMHSKFFRNVFSGNIKLEAKKKTEFDSAVFVSEKKTS